MAEVMEQARTQVEEWAGAGLEAAFTTGASLLEEVANGNGLEQVRTEVEGWAEAGLEAAITTGALLLEEVANGNGLDQNGDHSESDRATNESGSEEGGAGHIVETREWNVEGGLKAAGVATGGLLLKGIANGNGLFQNEGSKDSSDNYSESDVTKIQSTVSHFAKGESSSNGGGVVGEVVEEEIVELEFEKVKPKLATHSMHCPNCNSEITKVTLRRKVILSSLPPINPPVDTEPTFGCLSCFSFFTSPENGRFKPFELFRKTTVPQSTVVPPPAGENESCFSMFGVIRNPIEQPVDPRPLLETVTESRAVSDVEAGTGDARSPPGRSWLGYDGVLADILKSIVYGGLLEVIASLSVVASAAASDASTLSIISVALATLIGGVFVIGHNLWDLKNDCSKDTSKYTEQLGHVNYFPLHAFFAMLSFIVFGMVPPAAYGFAFHKTNDKDFTIVAAATASLLCIVLLAIFKSFINKCTAFEYIKTVVYYITTAVSVSGVSYVAGNLLTRVMEEFGLFDKSLGTGGMSLLSHTTTPSLSSF